MPGLDQRLPDPPRCKDAAELAMREQRDIAPQAAQPGDQPVGPVQDLRW